MIKIIGQSIITTAFIVMIFICGCTENVRTKSFGGTTTINLPAGEKLINITWKSDEMWYLSRPMHADETAEEYKFKEKSNFGVLEGTVIIKETK